MKCLWQGHESHPFSLQWKLLFLLISSKWVNDCRKPSAVCNAPLRGWHSRAELSKERNVLCGEALQCLTASRAQPQARRPSSAADGYWKQDTNIFRLPHEESHQASILCHFAKGAGNLFSKRQTVQFYTISLKIACSLTQHLCCPPELSIWDTSL